MTLTPRDEPDPGQRPRVRPYVRGPDSAPEPVVPPSGPSDGPATGEPALRPFVLTSGRVVGIDPNIGLETQVTARPAAEIWVTVPVAELPPERRAIVDLCVEPHSVAEISAQLNLHLGVTRVLVGDLRDAGYLDVHILDADASTDPEIILRVMRGLRAIS